MKLAAVLLALGLLYMFGVMLITTSTDAFARQPFTAAYRSVSADDGFVNKPAAKIIAITSQFDPGSHHSEAPGKHLKKRFRNRCARITATCWSAA